MLGRTPPTTIRRAVTQAQVRRLALALPEVRASSHFSRPDFRVRNRIFATLPPDGRTLVLRLTPANVHALIAADAATFSNAWRGRWLGIKLDRVPLEMLRELLFDAWRIVAPKRLSASYASGPGPHRKATR